MTTHIVQSTLRSSGIGKLIPLLLTLLTVAGCARHEPEPPDAAAFALPPQHSTNKQPNSSSGFPAGATSKNLDSPVPANWTQIARTWLSTALQKPGKTLPSSNNGVLSGGLEPVTIDLIAVAARHPAWRLADALQGAKPIALPFSTVDVPGINVIGTAAWQGAGMAPGSLHPLRTSTGATFTNSGSTAGFYRPELTIAATGFSALERRAQQRQNDALAAFIGDAAQAQDVSLKMHRLNLEAGLDDDIEASQHIGLAELEPRLLSDPIQLEMTNLRLRLLEKLYTTEAEREAAEKRLQILEAQWEEKLRSQEADRLAELMRLRNEVPQRLRGEGATRIALELDAVRRRYNAAREAVAEAQRARIAQDFITEENPLSIVLPSAALPSQKLETHALTASTQRARRHDNVMPGWNNRIIKTVQADTTSTARTNVSRDVSRLTYKTPLATGRAAQIRALRTIAMADARRWARSVAQRSGWQWIENSHSKSGAVSAPDRTREVLRLLNLNIY